MSSNSPTRQTASGYSGGNPFLLKRLVTSVPNGANTSLIILPVFGLSRILVKINPTVQNLNTFRILARCSTDDTNAVLYSTAAAFTGPVGLIVGASGDLTTLTAGSNGWFIMDVSGLFEVTIDAGAAVSSALVDVYASGS